MRYIVIASIFILTQGWAQVSMAPTDKVDKDRPKPGHPIAKPPQKPDRPAKRVHQHYYTTVISDCEKYIEIIEKRDEEIKALKEELYRLRSVEQAELRKELKEEYKHEMKKFNERRNTN